MSRSVSILLLCEDKQARVFVESVLEQIDPSLLRRLRVVPFPVTGRTGTDQGLVDGYKVYPCGSMHIRENYPQLVSQRRQNAGRFRAMGCRLIVQIDVDNSEKSPRSVADRRAELVRACEAQKITPPAANEPVAHLIPRRNIETWIVFGNSGQPVDEGTEYPHLTGHESDCEPAARRFAEECKTNQPSALAPPSWTFGLSELRKVL